MHVDVWVCHLLPPQPALPHWHLHLKPPSPHPQRQVGRPSPHLPPLGSSFSSSVHSSPSPGRGERTVAVKAEDGSCWRPSHSCKGREPGCMATQAIFPLSSAQWPQRPGLFLPSRFHRALGTGWARPAWEGHSVTVHTGGTVDRLSKHNMATALQSQQHTS